MAWSNKANTYSYTMYHVANELANHVTANLLMNLSVNYSYIRFLIT